MSHELGTPLYSIIGFSRVILKGIDGPINDLQKQDLDAIHNSGQHLLDMINDILDLSRIEAGKMDLSIEELDIKETIDSVMSTVKGLIKEKPVRIINNSPENLPMVSADRTRARQILINMFSNAVKFTDEGTITLDVTVEQEPRPQIRLVVKDTGIGISQEDQDKLFARFSQVDSSPTRKAGGTGLGLNISRSLVELMGGEMGVNSELGQGSTFYFTLPIVGSVSSTPDQQIGGRLIIAIEDDEKVVDLYRKYLRPHGFRVVGITEPDHVLAQVLSMMPYAVTIDPLMAKGKGWDLLGQLTNNPVTRNIPILVCSILEEHEKAESLGARDYILKPMREEHLVNAVLRLSQEKGISRQRILVVDDDPNVMHLVEKATRRQRQMELEYAQGGQKGLEALHDHRPDAVILDLFMPDMDGFSFLETLHKDPDMKSIPVVVLTGAELTESEKRRLEKYRRHLLFKGSFKADELITSIQRAIEDNISS
jgi:CheY-like chemotaxis protein/two-component sensor histidine kinase